MPSALRYHEIVESGHRVLDPITAEELALLGEIVHPRPGQRMPDLGCGKAELISSGSLNP